MGCKTIKEKNLESEIETHECYSIRVISVMSSIKEKNLESEIETLQYIRLRLDH